MTIQDEKYLQGPLHSSWLGLILAANLGPDVFNVDAQVTEERFGFLVRQRAWPPRRCWFDKRPEHRNWRIIDQPVRHTLVPHAGWRGNV